MSPTNPGAPRGTHAAGDHAGKMAREAAQLAADLRRKVSVMSLDSFPAYLTATLVDRGQTFRASATAGTPEAGTIVDDVVAQALTARKAVGG